MTPLSQKILTDYQIRKTKQQKQNFRAWLCAELENLGYAPRVESGNFSHNVVVGNPETAKVIYTAHYDTCAVMPVPNFITPRNMFWYLLYQVALIFPMFALAIAAEVGTIFLWESLAGTDCPMWLAMGVVYLVLGFEMWWLMAGPANKHTVNDNTSGTITLLELAQSLPEELRSQVCLVFFDNEEKGLLGSGGFAAKYKDVKKTGLVVNFDCVSDGDYIQFFPTKALKAEHETITALKAAFPSNPHKITEVVTGFGFYPSDQAQFRRGVGVCALKKKPVFGYYMDRIHTGKDTVLMEDNIHLLVEGAVQLTDILSK